MGQLRAIFVLICLSSSVSFAYSWQLDEKIPAEGLTNPYNVRDLSSVRREGFLHALYYPVDVTGTLMPLDSVQNFIEADSKNPVRKFFEELFQGFSKITTMDDTQKWLGLNEFPFMEGEGAFFVPFRDGVKPSHRMGFTPVMVSGRTRSPVNAFTISCAACHTSNLFGRPVMGLTNRFPRANEAFVKGAKATKLMWPSMFNVGTGASDDEVEIYRFTRENLKAVGPKSPAVMGLDTSLAHTALSLSKRSKNLDATKSGFYEKFPREDGIRYAIADSKPAPWWNVKYKNKWLFDGSVVAGNPIFTNILWNEIGRGTDLVELRNWFSENQKVIEELTTAVYSSEAPHITDYFAPEEIDMAAAQRGEVHFKNRCQKCHGEYVKGWSNASLATQLSGSALKVAQLKTEKVIYFEETPVKDVGTDPLRRESMASLVQLNDLRISKENGILIKVQKGYVPPPLVGIWARFPYFHNNSVPTLCDVLVASEQRPKAYWARPANDRRADFDLDCNGYPRARKEGLGQEYLYRSNRPGLSNSGHDARIFIVEGREIFTPDEKRDLVRFLQTL
jgi:mono/diheme cytochrome c family protein